MCQFLWTHFQCLCPLNSNGMDQVHTFKKIEPNVEFHVQQHTSNDRIVKEIGFVFLVFKKNRLINAPKCDINIDSIPSYECNSYNYISIQLSSTIQKKTFLWS